METNTSIDALYNLIETSTNHHQTFIDNLDLWKQFYDDNEIIIRNNLLNAQLFTIIKFLLKQEHGEIFQYFHGVILTTLKHSQEKLSYDLQKEKVNITTKINNLFNNLNYYDELCKYVRALKLEDPLGEIQSYLSSNLQLNTARTLIIIISKNFFILDKELVKKTIAFISKSAELTITKKLNNKLETREFIYKYLDNILKIKLFIGDDLSKDTLLNLIKSHQIKDKKVIKYIFDNLSTDLIIKIFENDLNNIISFLNQITYVDDTFKYRILIDLLTNILKKEDYNPLVLDIIIKDNLSPNIPESIKNTLYNKIIIANLNTPIFELNSNIIKFLLESVYKDTDVENIKEENAYYEALTNFIANCNYLLKNEKYLNSKENFDIDGIKEILLTLTDEVEYFYNEDITQVVDVSTKFKLGVNIEFETSIKLLTEYLENKVILTEEATKAIIRSIAIKMLETLNIENNGVYYHKSNNNYGLYNTDELCISLNTKLITRFLNQKNSLYNRLKVLNTMFHEITHSIYTQARQKGIWTPEIYTILKEWIIADYDINYYEENYEAVKEEIEARIGGMNYLSKFIETFLPHLLDKIQDRIIEDLLTEEELKKEKNNDLLLILTNQQKEFNLIFDTLIRYNPIIIKNNPILNLEYYEDGTIKTYEDIFKYRNEENKDIIDEILKRRYPETIQPILKTTHNK